MSARLLAVTAAALASLALAGCSTVDLPELQAGRDLAVAHDELVASRAGEGLTLYVALDGKGARPDLYDPAHPDHYGMQANTDALSVEVGKIFAGAFARVDQHDAARTERDPRDVAFDKDDQLLLDVHVTKWDAVFVRKNGWWYPNAFFLAWYFYFPTWVIADEVYGVQATLAFELRAVRSGRTVARGEAVVDSRATRPGEAGDVPCGPLLELDDLDRGIDILGTYTPGELSREQWQTHVQVLLEPYARREAAKALAREVAKKLAQFKALKDADREALTAAVHAVVVGVGRSAQDTCEFASDDAAAFASCLGADTAATSSGVALDRVLRDAQATRTAVLAALETAAGRAQPEDALVFYFAGRGFRSSAPGLAGLGLSCYDAERAPGKEPGGIVTLAEVARILAQSRSKHPVLVLDTSFAGGPRGTEDGPRGSLDLKELLTPLARTNGAVIAACAPPERAQVLRPARHGLLTHALVAGLKGGADAGQGVTWDSLRSHLVRYVAPLSELTSADGEGVEPVFVLPDPAGRALR